MWTTSEDCICLWLGKLLCLILESRCIYKPHSPVISSISGRKRWFSFLAALFFCVISQLAQNLILEEKCYLLGSLKCQKKLTLHGYIRYTQQTIFNTWLMCNFISNISQGLTNVHYETNNKKISLLQRRTLSDLICWATIKESGNQRHA